MMVEVKRKHIRAGIPRDCQECPVALALYDTTGDSYVSVGIEIAVGPFDRFRSSQAVIKFLRDFDEGRPVKPFKFRLIRIKESK